MAIRHLNESFSAEHIKDVIKESDRLEENDVNNPSEYLNTLQAMYDGKFKFPDPPGYKNGKSLSAAVKQKPEKRSSAMKTYNDKNNDDDHADEELSYETENTKMSFSSKPVDSDAAPQKDHHHFNQPAPCFNDIDLSSIIEGVEELESKIDALNKSANLALKHKEEAEEVKNSLKKALIEVSGLSFGLNYLDSYLFNDLIVLVVPEKSSSIDISQNKAVTVKLVLDASDENTLKQENSFNCILVGGECNLKAYNLSFIIFIRSALSENNNESNKQSDNKMVDQE